MTQQSISLAAGAALPTVTKTITQEKINAYAKASGADQLIAKAFSGHMASMIAVAALMGQPAAGAS